ncbi:zinc finger protein 883 [Ixodes scapularis]
MPWCCVPLCKGSAKKGNRLFPFPRDKVRRKIWETQVQRDRWKVTNGSRICERHFEQDQFEQNRQDGRRLLKSSAVPTLFASSRSNLDGTAQSTGHVSADVSPLGAWEPRRRSMVLVPDGLRFGFDCPEPLRAALFHEPLVLFFLPFRPLFSLHSLSGNDHDKFLWIKQGPSKNPLYYLPFLPFYFQAEHV